MSTFRLPALSDEDFNEEEAAGRIELSMSDTEWLECLADAIDEQCYAVNATPSGFHAHDIDIAAKKVRHERALRTLRNDVQNGNREAVGKFVIDALHGYLLGVAEERR